MYCINFGNLYAAKGELGMKREIVLPKNIRQIGEIQQEKKVYLEDYVMTYIRKKEKEGQEGCAGILLGRKETDEQGTCLFLTGALLLDQEKETQERWTKLEEEKNAYFPELEMWGYFLIGTMEEEGLEEITERLSGTPAIIFHLQEGEENVYWSADRQCLRMKGYFIFYERNPQMQKYIAETGEPQRVEEEGVSDKAIVSFREKVKEKAKIKRGGGARYLASSFLVLTILMLGVTIVNNYDKIKSMEAMIEQLSLEQAQQMQELTQVMSMEVEPETTAQEVMAGAADTVSGAASTGTMQDVLTEITGVAQSSAGEDETTTGEEAAVQNEGETQEASPEISTAAQEASAETVATAQETSAETAAAVQGAVSAAAEEAQEASANAAVSIAEQSLAERNYSAEDASLINQDILGQMDETLASTARRSQSVYTIKYGDTLADISEKYYGTLEKVEEICKLNEIEDANLIVPGQKIVLP